MKTAILYICTGKYTCFWDRFYKSSEQFFLPNHEKHYYVFTDGKISHNDKPNVHIIAQENLGWPNNTLKRFHMFKRIKDELEEYDYIFFLNANIVFNKIVSDEILPSQDDGLLVVKHPGFFNKSPDEFTYERNPESTAFIEQGSGVHYVCGGFNGGIAKNFIKMIEDISAAIDIDEQNGIIARWHDESHLNKYILTHKYKVLSPAYAYPEGWSIPFEEIVTILDKSKFSQVEFLRGEKLDFKQKFKKLLLRAWNLAFKSLRKLRSIIGKTVIVKQRDFTPMVIVNVDGGLGSQMWQFALGLSVAESCGLPVKYDLTWFKLSGKDIKGENNRNFDLLKVFSGRFDFPVADEKELALYKRYFFYAPKLQCLYEKNVCFGKNARYLGGYYCHINYIKPIREKLIELFTPTIKFSDYNENMLQAITASENPVAVHVRRGDFIGSIHDVTTPDYFIKAINLMSEKLDSPKFFIFSNDIAYAKELFTKQNGNFVFVEGNDNDHGYDDLNLMRQCKNFIISNSGFGWWAAFLADNQNKIVIAPERWFKSNSGKQYIYNESAYIDEGWFTLPC